MLSPLTAWFNAYNFVSYTWKALLGNRCKWCFATKFQSLKIESSIATCALIIAGSTKLLSDNAENKIETLRATPFEFDQIYRNSFHSISKPVLSKFGMHTVRLILILILISINSNINISNCSKINIQSNVCWEFRWWAF